MRLNPLVHGFAGQTCFVPDHEKEAYLKHFQSFRAEFNLRGPSEQFLVQSLSELSWSAQQIRAQIHNFMAMAGAKGKPMHETGNLDMNYSLAQANVVSKHIQQINLLGIYEQRKMRLFQTTRKELVQIQADRKKTEKEQLEEAAFLRKLCKTARRPSEPEWQPTQNGFACSLEEIDRYIVRTERMNALADRLKMAS